MTDRSDGGAAEGLITQIEARRNAIDRELTLGEAYRRNVYRIPEPNAELREFFNHAAEDVSILLAEVARLSAQLVAREQERDEAQAGLEMWHSKFLAMCEQMLTAEAQLAACEAQRGTWQSIATLRPFQMEKRLFYWIRPKRADEAYLDSSNCPITVNGPGWLHVGKHGTWNSLMTATHWMEYWEPSAPAEDGPQETKAND